MIRVGVEAERHGQTCQSRRQVTSVCVPFCWFTLHSSYQRAHALLSTHMVRLSSPARVLARCKVAQAVLGALLLLSAAQAAAQQAPGRALALEQGWPAGTSAGVAGGGAAAGSGKLSSTRHLLLSANYPADFGAWMGEARAAPALERPRQANAAGALP